MKYILLIWISTFSAKGGLTMTTAEFNNQKACEDAADIVRTEFASFFTQPPFVKCVEKGE